MRIFPLLLALVAIPLGAQSYPPPRPTPIPPVRDPHVRPRVDNGYDGYDGYDRYSRRPVITVTGTSAIPFAMTQSGTMSITLDATASSRTRAQALLSQKLATLRQALLSAGVPSSNIQGSEYTVTSEAPYTATRTLMVTTDTRHAAHLSDVALSHHASSVSSLDPAPLSDHARSVLMRQAILDARRQAEALADEADATLGPMLDAYQAPSQDPTTFSVTTRWRLHYDTSPDDSDYSTPDHPTQTSTGNRDADRVRALHAHP